MVAAAAALASASPALGSTEDTRPQVHPAAGHRTTGYVLRLVVRQDLGVHAATVTRYAVRIGLADRRRCSVALSVATGRAGRRVSERLAAPRAAGWCRGRYLGTVSLERRPYCPDPSAAPCPMVASERLEAGRFAFRVG